MGANLINAAYLAAAILFILGLKGLTSPRTAVRGNFLGALGMLLAVAATLGDRQIVSFETIALGVGVGTLIGAVLGGSGPDDRDAPVGCSLQRVRRRGIRSRGRGDGPDAGRSRRRAGDPDACVQHALGFHRGRHPQRQSRSLGQAPRRAPGAAAGLGYPNLERRLRPGRHRPGGSLRRGRRGHVGVWGLVRGGTAVRRVPDSRSWRRRYARSSSLC